MLKEPHERFFASLATYEAAAVAGGPSSPEHVRSLALDFVWAGRWLRDQAASYPRANHADDFLADEVLGGLAGDFEVTARALFTALDERAPVPAERVSQLLPSTRLDV